MPAEEKPSPRRRRWWWVLVALLVLAVAAPTLLSYTPLPASLLASQLPAEAGTLSARAVWLAWTGPIEVTGLDVLDAGGSQVLSVERVSLAGGLIGLASGDAAPLRVTVDQPRLDLVIGPGGSNLDAIVAALERKRDPAEEPDAASEGVDSPSRPLYLIVHDAAVRITETQSEASWVIQDVDVRVEDPGLGVNAIEATLEGAITSTVAEGQPPEPEGRVSLRLGDGQSGGRLAEVKAGALPLGLVAPWLRLADPTAEASGSVSVSGQAAWNSEGLAVPSSNRAADVVRALAAGGLRATGVTRFEGVEVLGAATGGGPAVFGDIEAPWSVATEGQRLVLQSFAVSADAGSLEVAGSLDADEIDRWSSGESAAPRDLRVDGEIDLGRLALGAPQLVRLQRGARIDTGRIQFNAASVNGRLDATVQSGPLSGVADGRRIDWREPLDVQLSASQAPGGGGLASWALEAFDARSSFFRATAAGNSRRLAGELTFDLSQLASEIDALLELGAARIAGDGRAEFEFERATDTGRWRVIADGGVNNLLVGSAAAPYADEPSLDFRADLSGVAGGAEPPTGLVEVIAREDRLSVDLGAADAGDRPFRVALSGDVSHWWRRAGVAGGLPAPEAIALSGRIEATASGVSRGAAGRFDEIDVALTNLALDTASLGGQRVRLRDERIEGTGRGTWDAANGSFNLTSGELASSVASARIRDVVLSTRDPEASRGEAVARLDLSRLARWLPPAEGPQQYGASGVIDAAVTASGVTNGMALKMNLNGADLRLLDRAAQSEVVWSEPELRAESDLLVSRTRDAGHAITLREMVVRSESINGSANGRIADAVAMKGIEFRGAVDYDLAKLSPMLWPQLGDDVRLVGRDQAAFQVASDSSAPSSAPVLARLRARVEAPWEGADLFGLPVGPGRLGVTLERGVATVDPLDVAIGRGRLTATATAKVSPPPGNLTLQPGPLVSDVDVSREVTDRFLKFIAPVLADAAMIAGSFTVALSEFEAPLNQPSGAPPGGTAAGFLDIARVRVTPGPRVEEWIKLVQQIEGVARDGPAALPARETVLVAIDDSRVQFQFANGRVYHNGLVFYVGDARVESTGSVGIEDETLDLVLTVPILEEWIQKQPQFLTRLRGQAIRIPIRGTFSRPQVDSDQFRRLSRQLLENAAVGAIEGGLNRLFERLRER